ncbi:hypothetical protein BB558_003649 [Smittium angustum]|uniref:Uncharacterized protein n=1 Tax=Smittium angustum TaxID=133377 RepID=A0A2U1J5K9_SMIAN|nr:hypothetical protein BB558_003649 [Smittium angustum]
MLATINSRPIKATNKVKGNIIIQPGALKINPEKIFNNICPAVILAANRIPKLKALAK